MLKNLFVFLIFLQVSNAEVLRVALASNVIFAFEQIKEEFYKTNPDIKLEEVVSSSGKLAVQILNGANYDIFVSADTKYPEKIYKSLKNLQKPKIYAQGLLVLLKNNKNININDDFSSLIANKNTNKIAIANPKTAPYGKASLEVLKNIKNYEKIKHKIVFASSLVGVVAYLSSGADIGFVSKSTLFSKHLTHLRHFDDYIMVDESLYQPINQSLIVIKPSRSAKKFFDFILSAKSQKIFKSFGYNIKNY